MPQTFLPAGTATGNADAVRAAPIAQAYYLFADILGGVDSQPRMEAGMTTNDGLLGPTSSFGVDIGIAADGSFYARGRSSAMPDASATPNVGTLPIAGGLTRSPIFWLVVAFVAYKVLK